MADAVLEARKEAGVTVRIGGACSSANTRDKLFCDGTGTFLPWLDFVSIHYQPLSADAVLEPKWMNRKGDYGRVRVWDSPKRSPRRASMALSLWKSSPAI